MSVISPGYYLYFWPTGYKLEIPKSPLLGSINLLKWLTEIRRPIYSLDCWFITKGYNSETVRWKTLQAVGRKRAWSFHILSECTTLPKSPSVRQPRSPPNPFPWEFCGGFFSDSEVPQSCPVLCDPMDSSQLSSSVHGIFQARILEWVAISFSRGVFPTQGSNLDLPHCRQTLYHLSH